MKAVKCACCGGSMKRNGKTSSGAQRWRARAGASATVRYDDAAARLEEFPVVVAVEGHAARDAGRRPDFQAQDRGVLGGLAHAGARRRVPPGPLRRRLARGTPGRADLLQRGSVVSWYMAQPRTGGRSALAELIPAPDVVTTAAASPAVRGLAGPRCEMPVSRVARSRGVRREAEAPGGPSCPDRARPHAYRDAAPGGAVARALPTGAGSGPTSSRTPRSSTGGGSHPREAQEGEEVAVLAGLGGDAVHLPRSGAHEGRPAPFDQQQDRGGVNAQLRGSVLRNHRGSRP